MSNVHVGTGAQPFERVVQALRRHGHRFKHTRTDQVRVFCPCHTERRPSLTITWWCDKVRLKCFAGCDNLKILRALGLTTADLYDGPRVPTSAPIPVAAYDYYSLDGELNGRKTRFAPKAFRWSHSDPTSPGAFLPGLTQVVGLYRLPGLVGTSRVFMTEGERATDLLWTFGLPATCPPDGASTWKASWSADLQVVGCRELVILADNDQAGSAHAERVAESVHELGIAVQVLCFTDLAAKADVVDFLDNHSDDELLVRVTETPIWTPGQRERDRLARKRQFRAARNRKLRLKFKTQRMAETLCIAETRRIAESVTSWSGQETETLRMSTPAAETPSRSANTPTETRDTETPAYVLLVPNKMSVPRDLSTKLDVQQQKGPAALSSEQPRRW